VEYINTAKLNKVKELIVNQGLSLREAGEKCGFYDANYLSKIFKKYTGYQAKEFKKHME